MTPTPSNPAPLCQPSKEHTPTPWRYSANSFGTQFIYGNPSEPRTSPMGVKYNDLVAGGDMPRALTEANAAFIVEAVNSHASLKARIEELEGVLRASTDKLGKVAAWLDRLATAASKSAQNCSYESLREAYVADASNYRKTASDIKPVVEAARAALNGEAGKP